MRWSHKKFLLRLALAATLAVQFGCAAFQSTSETMIYVGVLADSPGNVLTVTEVSAYGLGDMLRRGPEHNFHEWAMSVWVPASSERITQVVSHQGFGRWDDEASLRRDFDNVEARADSSGHRIWLVDKQTGRVVASADLDTKSFTGPDDESPSWARSDRGTVLTSIANVMYGNADP
jgi:hypothetical protein